MRKTFHFLLVAGAVAGLTSCTSDEPIMRDNDGNVAFTVSLPSMNTRSPYGDTPDCNQLTVTVYDAKGDVVIPDSVIKNAFGQGVTTQPLTLQLVKNQTYRAVFYANNKDSKFATYNNGEIEVDYAGLTPNSEVDDAFYRSYEFTVDGTPKNIYLKRPFAQVNIGTDDLNSKAAQHILKTLKTTLTVTEGLYTKMNLKDSTVDLESALKPSTSFVNPDTAKVNTDFPVPGYSNLLSVYLLVPNKRDLINASCEITNEGTTINSIALASTNVELNYRTNIYGTLITSQQPVNVIIEPAFGRPDIEVKLWDGSVTTPEIVNNEILISTPAELAGIAKMVNEGKTLSGVTVKLTADLDLANLPWTPAGNVDSYPSISFGGVFDGQGHTISNLNATNVAENKKYTTTGLFGSITGKIQNLTLRNFTVTSNHYAGAFCGYLSDNSKDIAITNCNAIDGTVTSLPNLMSGSYANGDKAGAILGYAGCPATISNCTVENVTVKAYRDVGGIVGASYANLTDCTIKNSTVIVSNENGYGKPESERYAGEIVGWVLGGTQTNCTYNDVLVVRNANVLSTVADFQNLATEVNGGKSFAGETILLGADLDLKGVDWNPIGNSKNPFKGTFEGNGHTISNMTISATNTSDEGAGFIGALNGGVIHNVNFVNANIVFDSGSAGGPGSGVVVGRIFPNGTVQNCTVSNATINCSKNAGGICGYAYGSFINNTVTDCTITATLGSSTNNDKVAGIIGYMGEGGYKIVDNYVSGCTMFGVRNIGGIIGCSNAGNIITDNTVENSYVYYSTLFPSLSSNTSGEIIGRKAGTPGQESNNTATNVTLERKSSL